MIRVCPYCFTSLEIHLSELDKVKCPNDDAKNPEDKCGGIVRNDYYAEIGEDNYGRHPDNTADQE